MKSGEKFDTIVIGAGLGGLTTAFEAARRGLSVLLVEQHNLPGGFATSFVRGRFEFEPSIHEMSNKKDEEDSLSAVGYLKSSEVDIEFLELPEPYRLILTDEGIDITLPFGTDEFINAIAEYVPGSRKSVTDYIKLCHEIHTSFGYLAKNRDASNVTLLKKVGNFIRTGSSTAQAVADKLGVPKKAQDIINAYWCYLGTPITKVSFTIWAAMFYGYISKPAVIPKSRSHEISTALTEKIEELGGKILFNTRVDKIIVQDGEAKAIETRDKKIFYADSFVSNASPTTVFSKLIHPAEETPLSAIKNVNARKEGFSFNVVYLGLNKSHKELGINEYSYFIGPHMDTEKLYKQAMKIDNVEPYTAAVCLNVGNPGASPEGTTILSLTVASSAEAWSQIDSSEYFNEKSRVADRVIDYFEKTLGVSIKPYIEEIEIATPQTFARYTGSFNGVVYGYQMEPWDGVIPRILSDKKERYIDRLFFAGGNAERAYGYASTINSGKPAIEKVIKRIKE